MKNKELVNTIFRTIAPIICYTAWVSYQIGAGQKYNTIPTKHQQKSFADAVEFFLRFPKATPRFNHENWVFFKKHEGWKYGKIKDAKKKTHPDIRPWKDLPKVEQNKDIQHLNALKAAYKLSQLIAVTLSKA